MVAVMERPACRCSTPHSRSCTKQRGEERGGGRREAPTVAVAVVSRHIGN